ncbi:chromosome segregation protein SMC [Symbiobacterium thermophilum]|uniref:Chromosome partition protein Smc n=1 Tax=Symbiobacterium thermophilum (strain DSM 24528 / JCM 14929 / IAM 14863 / T) TaxID=292459 RepID=Q67PF3_SYMTH|nr:chromosome segregation protein SMC [Symbiobacterium thermophilum]BAD40440.1 putative chromosome segregation SMC protein [Symbiobacterium thermophilum IAM 14863]
MYLKRLEILGFKSFAEKTELEFTPGITAVVGPNGSGKSNVSDAIRWVLGEQSARALRGGSMADVIFAGSDGKRAMGFAEVSLVLDNSDGALPLDFTEVMITRRVDRSGEGEYFINQVPCRLKDVQELFMDTGIGKENYSIIGQGRIDEILSSKPEDRRALFEEAAGISRYKARKREAQRRLEETEQNLLRITDIIGELTSNMDALAQQAEKATLYQELDGELTRLDVGLLARQLQTVVSRLEEQRAVGAELAQKAADIEQRMQTAEEALEVSRQLVAALDEELNVLSVRLTEAASRQERAEGRLALAVQQRQGLEADRARLERELESLAAKLAQVDAELADLKRQEAAVEQEGLRLAQELSALEAECRAAEQAAAAAQSEVEARKDRIVAILQLEAERRNGVQAAERAADEARRRLARLGEERKRAEADAAATRARSAEVAADKARLVQERETLLAELADLTARRQAADEELRDLEARRAALREEMQAASSRLRTIEELISGFEGYQRGPRTVLQGREKGAPWAADVLGAVAEVVRTEPRYERAIEVALGSAVQNLITATDAGAKAAIEHLKRTGGGRATFLPLNTIRPQGYRPEEEREFRGAPGILGVALELVRFDERFRPAIASLLGRTLVAETLDAALALGRRTGQRFRIVTLDGEVLAAGGAITGGDAVGRGSGLLARERERDELRARVQELQAELEAVRRACEQAAARRTDLLGRIDEASTRLRKLEGRLTQTEGDERRLSDEARRWAQVLETHAQEAASIEAEIAAAGESAERLRRELAELAAERQGLEAEVRSLTAEGQQREESLGQRRRAVTDLQVRLAGLHEQLRSLQAQRRRAEADREALDRERLGREQEQAAVASRLEQTAAEQETARAEAEEAAAARAALAAERDEAQARKLAAQEQVNARERELRSLRRALSDVQHRCQQGQVEEARLAQEQEGLVTRLAEQYELTAAEALPRALPEEETDFARARIAALREQIRELGPVNLQAIEDYRAARERLDFLQAQEADLQEAKASLYRAISELDRRIKSHFYESFQEIRQAFQQVFTELFEGGKADLRLVDEDDLLETGIEIIAQPPGKKAQPLSLLSGGERAMTAIALLFALLRVRPSPFVVLDEVEAALDEANVERFSRYLKHASEHCQFICITHQRGTMEVADALYGVTMEGTGVSRVVSVRLVDIETEAS